MSCQKCYHPLEDHKDRLFAIQPERLYYKVCIYCGVDCVFGLFDSDKCPECNGELILLTRPNYTAVTCINCSYGIIATRNE